MTIPARRRLGLPALLSAVILTGLVSAVTPAPASAAISSTERALISWINTDRVALGLKALRGWSPLYSIADRRASRMASAGVLSHATGGSLPSQLKDAGVRAWTYGEAIAASSYPRGLEAARHMYRMWKASPTHWRLITSRTFNYLGLGIAYRSSSGTSYAALVFTESPDHTGAGSALGAAQRKGTDITWSWRGWDVPLQTHMAGFANFVVQYRVDSGSWRTLWSATTATSWTVTNRSSGHYYGLRVRGRDRAGNLGAWTPEQRTWVP